MLDKLGLDKKDAEGFRLRTDGKGRPAVEIDPGAASSCSSPRSGDGPPAVEEDRHRPDGPGARAQPGVNEKSARNESQISRGSTTAASTCSPSRATSFRMTDGSRRPAASLLVPVQRWRRARSRRRSIKEVMEKFKKAFGVPEEERFKLGKEIWEIVADEVYAIGVIGLAAAASGIRIAKTQHGQCASSAVQQP